MSDKDKSWEELLQELKKLKKENAEMKTFYGKELDKLKKSKTQNISHESITETNSDDLSLYEIEQLIKNLDTEFRLAKEQYQTKTNLSPDGFLSGRRKNKALVNGVEIKWDNKSGGCSFSGLPMAMMWIDTTLAGLMAGVEAMVGPDRFALALQSEGRKSVESDWQIISGYSDFKEGFVSIATIAATAGWGKWELFDYRPEEKTCVFRVYNNWEGLYQKALGVCWGSAMLAGKFSGYCTKLFKTECWSTQTKFIAKDDDFDEFIVTLSDINIEAEIERIQTYSNDSNEEMAESLQKLKQTELKLLKEIETRKLAEQELKTVKNNLEKIVNERTLQLNNTKLQLILNNEDKAITENALIKSEAQFKIMFEQATVGIAQVDINTGLFTLANNKYCQIVGFTEQELLNTSVQSITHPDDLEKDNEYYDMLKFGEISEYSIEKRYIKNDGTIVWVELSASLLKESNSTDEFLVAVVTDITKRKILEKSLKESEQLYHTILKTSPNGIAISSLNGQLTFASDKTISLFGYNDINDITNLSIFDFLIEEDREKARDAIIQIINNKAVTNNHYTVYRKDGTKFAAELNSSLLCDSNGKPKGLITIIRDITDRKVFEEKLIESEEKYSSLIRYSSDPIFSFNPDETYRFVNEAFATPFGKTPEEIMGKTPHSIFSYEEAEKRLMAVRAVFKSGEKKEIEVRVDTVSGDINYYLTIVDPIKNEAGEIICVSCISKNITERKKIEQELQVSEERYRRLHETMRDCFVEVKMSGEIIEVNQSYIDMLGYTKEEIYKLKYTDITPEKWIEFEKMIVENEVLVLGYSGVYEKEYIKKDGTVFPVELRTYLIRDNNNNPLAMWAIVRDISERKLAEEELLESEVKYRELVQNSPDTIVIYIDGKIAFTNNAGLDLVKAKSLDQVLGKPILDFVHPQSVDLAKQRMKDITLTSNLLPIAEERFLCMDGSFVDVEVKSIPITYQRKPAVQVIARDISERKRAERELKDAKEQFELFFNTIPDAVVVTRQHDGVIVDINNSFTTISGYTREDVIGKTSNEINIYNNYEDRQKIAAQLLSKGYCNNFETVVQYKGGRLSTVIMSVIFFNLSGITHILNIVRDISDRKQIEEQLRQSEEKYRLLAENSSDVIWMLNIEDMRFTYVSPAIKINTGYTAEEACAMSITESLTKQSSDFVLNDFNSRVEKYNSGDLSETTKFYELQHVCKDGTIIWAESSTTFVTDSDGKIIGILGVTRNIEERKKAEMQIQQKNVELEELNATKDKFFSIIAHDLKTPFSGFLGLTKIMAEKVQDIPKDEMQDFAVNMQKSANNLYQLLENLLEWSRMQRGTKPFNPQYCDLGLILKQNIDLLSDFAKQKSIKIENKLTTNSEAFADIPMLYTVLRNLLSNAIKFTKKEGKVEIGVEDTNDKNIIIWIKDNGIGMNPVMLQKLFRIDQKITRPGTEGESSTGLGLLLSKEFIEKHGGKIWAESEQGIGSTFYFTLPKFENHRKY